MVLPMLSYFTDEMTTVDLISGETGAYVDGVWVSSFAASVPISIIKPQPLTANDMQLVEDGEHVRDYLRSWSETRVYTREGGEDADRIEFDGDTYKVTQNDDRSLDGVFYGFVMRRLDPGRG
jgi:hypothetical protein